jgi:hypothetical protein
LRLQSACLLHSIPHILYFSPPRTGVPAIVPAYREKSVRVSGVVVTPT